MVGGRCVTMAHTWWQPTWCASPARCTAAWMHVGLLLSPPTWCAPPGVSSSLAQRSIGPCAHGPLRPSGLHSTTNSASCHHRGGCSRAGLTRARLQEMQRRPSPARAGSCSQLLHDGQGPAAPKRSWSCIKFMYSSSFFLETAWTLEPLSLRRTPCGRSPGGTASMDRVRDGFIDLTGEDGEDNAAPAHGAHAQARLGPAVPRICVRMRAPLAC
jgi:hypothetical protein